MSHLPRVPRRVPRLRIPPAAGPGRRSGRRADPARLAAWTELLRRRQLRVRRRLQLALPRAQRPPDPTPAPTPVSEPPPVVWRPTVAPATWVRAMAVVLYGAMIGLSLAVAGVGWVDGWAWLPPDWASGLRHAGVGLAAGLGFVGLSRLANRLPLGDDLEDGLAEHLAPFAHELDTRDVIGAALLSGIGEELLFRGVLQPLCGIWIASILFGLAHTLGGKMWMYPLITGLMGLALGGLAIATGDLIAPIVVHAVINGCNLPELLARAREMDSSYTLP